MLIVAGLGSPMDVGAVIQTCESDEAGLVLLVVV